ncbi:hypothetical protein LV478_17510 [Komagataeibacter oboediens]|uniref:hypothetical protein n=1 Tax=Komagataeibacter oboediens TaxID=65958 RepID=UPI001905C7CD|nr:hypothetical protein [Komagataeibacter oboediens]MBV0887733.1 hypothetical protein [Komagataeibacter oboediens]MCK9820562.1 hypothetical protein [Komagataeibacter oboediens]WEQ52250.1 hypothetical protein LV478_17510 [Komagataeibacter oboediens]GCE79660.1 hypothetical protein MSKU3_1135 [Komagataeibacter oboediens]
MLVLLLGVLVILSLSTSGERGGGPVWHAVCTAACVCLSRWVQGRVGLACVMAVGLAALFGLLGVQMLHIPAARRERSGLRLAGGLACVAVLTQVIMQGSQDGMTARLMGMTGLAAILCGAWSACIARGPVALCAGLACGLDGVMLLAARTDDLLVMGEVIVAAIGLNVLLAAAPRVHGRGE